MSYQVNVQEVIVLEGCPGHFCLGEGYCPWGICPRDLVREPFMTYGPNLSLGVHTDDFTTNNIKYSYMGSLNQGHINQ